MDATRTLKVWIKASRLASQLYICIPLIVGQFYARAAGYEMNGWVFFWVQCFGLCLQLYIVYANDYADVEADRINRTFTPYSGGSRVLIDGEIGRTVLGRAAVLLASLALCNGLLLGLVWGRWFAAVLAVVSILLLQMYSYRPVRLNYRGGGEILQMIGTGLVLPVFGWYAQAGTLTGFPVSYLAFILPAMLACAIGTSLPDEISDREIRKRSATVLLGQLPAQAAVIGLHSVSVLLLFLVFMASAHGAVSMLGLAALLAIAAQFLMFGGRPGSSRLLGFGAAAIVATLLLMLASAFFPPVPRYNFLMLCLLLALPPITVYGLRPDLRRPMRITALVAMPFAIAEPYFLNAYWSPEFIFDLGSIFGFGIEDFLFVALLGMLTCASYPAVFRKRLAAVEGSHHRFRCLLPLLSASVALTLVLFSSIPVILGTGCVMALFIALTWLVRRDLVFPSLCGGAVTGICYWMVCLAWQGLYPGIFAHVWNPEALSGICMAGVPVEELIYALLAGVAGTMIYPILTHNGFGRIGVSLGGVRGQTINSE